MTRPFIGITTHGRREQMVTSHYYEAFFSTPTPYIDAVRRAGGIPLLLPPGETDWSSILSRLDGVIVTGGGDVHPDVYQGNSEHTALTLLDPERDESEIGLIRCLVERRDIPVLAVCRGMQVLNVALGGTLHEHIPDVRDRDIHRSAEGHWTVQTVAVDANSQLASIMDATEVETYSGHHQAVKDIAEGLTVTATATDGIVEGLELAGHPWFVAVQWHPEITADHDPTQQRLFDALVEAASASS